MSNNTSLTAQTIQVKSVVDGLREHPVWVLMVCPDPKQTSLFRKALAVICGEGDNFSGRTALLKEGGKVTIACVDDEPLDPGDEKFVLSFVGHWGSGQSTARMKKWRSK